MPNGRYFLNDLEFEQHIKEMNDRQLLEFTARQTYDVCNLTANHSKRIKKLENRTKKEIGVTGGIGAGIGVVIAGVIDYFLKRG